MKNEIKIGYEIQTGNDIKIPLSHLVATGITQESGKTTTLEALIDRGECKAIIFKTKPGEKSITKGMTIMPFFKEDFDWEYAAELLEASRKEKLKFERSWIIKYSKNADSLIEFKSNIDKAMADDKNGIKRLRELEKSVLITLQAYLEKILPELQYAPLSPTLELNQGINIMDLERLKEETQSVIIRSTIDEILRNFKNVVIVIPEAWKFLPERYSTPVKRPAEKFIRQGATNNNYLWIDSQDITGVSKTVLKQVSTWILGYQREINEIKRTLDQIPLPKKNKPSVDDIASLKLGHFYVATKDFTKLIYVQPSWMSPKLARNIAKGNVDVSTVEKPIININPVSFPKIEKTKKIKKQKISEIDDYQLRQELKHEIDEIRTDFFKRINEINIAIKDLYDKIYNFKPSVNIDENIIVNKVLQKIPLQNDVKQTTFNEEELIKKIISKIPVGVGSVVYEVSPIEKIKKDFLEEAKNKILSDIKILDDEQKKILKFVETQGKGCNQTMILSKCLFVSATSGGTRSRISQKCKDMSNSEIMRMDKNAVCYSYLRERIKILLGTQQAPDQEIENLYNHILMELI